MVGLIDTTLRDGVQALWSSRIPLDRIVPIARSMDEAGYEAIDFMASVQFEVAVKHLNENPWERIRAVRKIIRKTPLITHIRSRSMTSFDIVADDVLNLMIERLAVNGFRRVMILDALHDLENLRFGIAASKKCGFHVSIILFYTISPVHTPEYYARKVTELAALGADSICIRDPSGLLTPERVREFLPSVRKALGDLPLQLKSHCNTGLAEECYMEAMRAGVDFLFTATTPLANGPSVPSVESIVARAHEAGAEIALDRARLQDIADYFTQIARDDDKPLGKALEHSNADQYKHQVPGGMIGFLKNQLAVMRLEHMLPAILEEFPKVRADLGYPVVVTPISQLIGVQAVLNVVDGERYKNIPIEVQKYVLGYYGKPEAPVDAELADKVATLAKKRPVPVVQGDTLKRIRDQYGPFDSDDDLLLHILFRPDQLAALDRRRASALLRIAGSTLPDMLRQAARCKRLAFIHVKNAAFDLQAIRRAPAQR